MPDEPTKLPADLDAWVGEVKERCDAASDSPWGESPIEGGQAVSFATIGYDIIGRYGDCIASTEEANGKNREDAAFISNARADLPTALAIIADLRAKVRDLTTQTTLWHCEDCGRVRDGRGCVRCLRSRLAAAEAVCEAARRVAESLEVCRPWIPTRTADYIDASGRIDKARESLAAYDATKSKGVG